MKKIHIWLASFSLLQQFIAIGIATISILIFFVFSYLNTTIDTYVNGQMYSYIHLCQNTYIQAQDSDIVMNENIKHFIYSRNSNRYLTSIEGYESIISRINPIIGEGTYDGYFKVKDVDIVYSVTTFTEDYTLISIVQNDYRNTFRDGLVSGVVSVTIYVVVGIIALLMLWVVSLISPLNQIRNYINKLRGGEPAQLYIERRDEIGEVAEALTSMNEELAHQKRIREEMIQNVSHDLKTPIATIKSYSESIKDGIYPYGTLEKSVNVIIEHADRLEKKVYSLITFNKLGYMVDNCEGLNLWMSPIIQKAILSVQLLRNDITIDTDIDDGVYFHGEEEAWRIVVENILDNALRYAKNVVKIHLEDNLLEIYNDGDPIDKDHLDKMFKPYEKGTKGQFGLGLSIVKKICDTYGYTVLGENLDNGVVFRFYTTKKMKKPSKKKNVKKGIIES